MMPFIIIAVMFLIFWAMLIKPFRKSSVDEYAPQPQPWELDEMEVQSTPPRAREYQAISLLTNYEKTNYRKLKNYADAHNLLICPKVRLADLIEPLKGTNRSVWQTRFNKIAKKHVDFVLCDQDMNVKVILELDDSSHQRADRQARDQMVNDALTGAGYTIVHIRTFDDRARMVLDNILGFSQPA